MGLSMIAFGIMGIQDVIEQEDETSGGRRHQFDSLDNMSVAIPCQTCNVPTL